MNDRIATTADSSGSRSKTEIAVLEVMCANRNALVATEILSVVPSQCKIVDRPEDYVSIKIVNSMDPEDVYYLNDPTPADLLVVDKVLLCQDMNTEFSSTRRTSRPFRGAAWRRGNMSAQGTTFLTAN